MNKLLKKIANLTSIILCTTSTYAIKFNDLPYEKKREFLTKNISYSFYAPEIIITFIQENSIEDLEIFKQGLLLIQHGITDQTLSDIDTLIQSTQSEDINFSLSLLTKDLLWEYASWPKDKQIFYHKLRELFINASTIFTQPLAFTQMLNDLLPTDLQVFWQLVFQQVSNSTETTYNELIDAFILSCTRYKPFCKTLWFELGEKIKKELYMKEAKELKEKETKVCGVYCRDIVNFVNTPKKTAQKKIGNNLDTFYTEPASNWNLKMINAFYQMTNPQN